MTGTPAGKAIRIATLRDANTRRTLAAARHNRHVAEQALAAWQPGWPQTWHQIAEAILDHPGMTWAQMAPTIGMTKSQATSHFRRMRITVTGQ